MSMANQTCVSIARYNPTKMKLAPSLVLVCALFSDSR
jgi:hypothetical protein